MRTAEALLKQLFGARYESAWKSLFSAGILFFAFYAAEIRLAIAPSVLYLTSTIFTAGVMWQTLAGRRHMEAMQGMFLLPFENRSFVFSYVAVLGLHALITKTMLIWALFLSVGKWNITEILTALLCGCMACMFSGAAYRMCRKGNFLLPAVWGAGILAVILLVRRPASVPAAALLSIVLAVLYLNSADAYDFYRTAGAKRPVRYKSRNGSVSAYLARYLMANKNYLVNTAGLCAAACFLPLLFDAFQGMNMFPAGLAVLSMNTPVCTLLSCDPDLEQAVRVLPGQAGRFCRSYCLFIFAVNGIVDSIYLLSWQVMGGGLGLCDVGMGILFALLSAVLSVILEWKRPIRGWKTESDLWHHPRKYLVPLIMLLIAGLIGI